MWYKKSPSSDGDFLFSENGEINLNSKKVSDKTKITDTNSFHLIFLIYIVKRESNPIASFLGNENFYNFYPVTQYPSILKR
jgi:hypothetical protein